MKAISHVKCLQDFAYRSYEDWFIFHFAEKMKKVYRIFSVTQYISDPYFVLFYACKKVKVAHTRMPSVAFRS